MHYPFKAVFMEFNQDITKDPIFYTYYIHPDNITAK